MIDEDIHWKSQLAYIESTEQYIRTNAGGKVVSYMDFFIKKDLFHSIHTSERKAFRACRRRWDWSYRQGFHPTVMPKPLEFGIAYHTAMEVWYEPESWNLDRNTQSQLAVNAFVTVCQKQLNNYRALNGEPSDVVYADYKERVELGVKMIRYYTERISPKLDKGLKPLAVELPFEVPMPLLCKCDSCWAKWTNYLAIDQPALVRPIFRDNWPGLPVTFGGRIDAVMQDEYGRVLVFDWKTAMKLMDGDDEAAFLELDDQVGGYPVALWKSGRRVDGFIYHEQRKSVPEAPKELKRKYKGKIFSTARDEPVEYESFLNTVMHLDGEAYKAGLYDEYLEYLQGPMKPKFYQRNTILKTEAQMKNFWSDLIDESQDMLRDPRIYPQASRFSCNSCLYRQPCEGKNRDEDYLYTLNSMYIKDRL